MKSFKHIPRTSIGSTSDSIQRTQGSAKVIVDNRPTMVKQLKIQAGVNHRLNSPGVIQAKWHKVDGQEGQFEGNVSYHHIHSVGGNEHYKYGNDIGTRVNFITKGFVKQSSLAIAISKCEESGLGEDATEAEEASQRECLAYLRSLVKEEKAKPVVSESTPPPTDRKPAPKPGPVKKDKYADWKPKDSIF